MPKRKVKMSYLVRWLDDEQEGVMPSSALKNDEKAYVGSFVEFHWGKSFYNAEILKISRKLPSL